MCRIGFVIVVRTHRAPTYIDPQRGEKDKIEIDLGGGDGKAGLFALRFLSPKDEHE